MGAVPGAAGLAAPDRPIGLRLGRVHRDAVPCPRGQLSPQPRPRRRPPSASRTAPPPPRPHWPGCSPAAKTSPQSPAPDASHASRRTPQPKASTPPPTNYTDSTRSSPPSASGKTKPTWPPLTAETPPLAKQAANAFRGPIAWPQRHGSAAISATEGASYPRQSAPTDSRREARAVQRDGYPAAARLPNGAAAGRCSSGGSGQDKPTMVPSSSRSIREAAGVAGSPGIVITSPHTRTTKPAPAESRTSRTCRS